MVLKCWPALLGATLAVATVLWGVVHVRKKERARKREKLHRWRGVSQLQEVCTKYGITIDGGFLPAECVKRLSSPKYLAWEVVPSAQLILAPTFARSGTELARAQMIMDNLPALNSSGELKGWIESLPLLDDSGITDDGELRRAYIVLTMLLHSFVHGPLVPWPRQDSEPAPTSPSNRRIPPQLSVPLVAVCRRLGLPPVLTAAMDLWNWEIDGVRKFVKQSASAPRPEDLTLISTMTGTRTERFFHMIPCSMQARMGPLIAPLFLVPERLLGPLQAAKGEELTLLEEELVAFLGDLKMRGVARDRRRGHVTGPRGWQSALRECQSALSQVRTLVDPSTFYDVYRPLLGGFAPEGIELEGVSLRDCTDPRADGGFWGPGGGAGGRVEAAGESSVRVAAKGPSAGQSAMFFVIDALLGVVHSKVPREFQQEMASLYLPAPHRRLVQDFVTAVERSGSVASYVASRDKSGKVAPVLWQCRDLLAGFRSMHLGVASKYLKNAETGTGGSNFKNMLKAAWLSSARPLNMKL